jgi:hypothetical protein
MIQQYTSAELTESYFRDNVLQQYQREHGKLEGLYYEARGSLYEPHDGRTMDVGTREVEAYETPPHLYNKILFVEKRGQYPLLKSARLMERYDMAILTSQGFATTAARTLLEDADKSRTIQIFCLHDADPKGYNIAHTIREATERMPEYSVEVIDLGLTVEQGLALGIEPENFNRDKAMDKRVLKHLDPSSPAWEFFGADRPQDKNVPCKRIELDALTGPQAIALIEEGLNAEGVYGKVVPPEEELPSLAEGRFRALHARWVKEALHEVVGLPALQRALADEFMEASKLENSERYIKARFKKDDALSWRKALDAVLQDIHDAKLRDALEDAVRKAAREALSEGGDE